MTFFFFVVSCKVSLPGCYGVTSYVLMHVHSFVTSLGNSVTPVRTETTCLTEWKEHQPNYTVQMRCNWRLME